MVTDTVEASAVTVKGRFCSSSNTASGGYIAGLLGRLMDGPARVSLEQPVPVDHGLGIERLGDGGLTLTDGAVTLAHASPATLQLEPPAPVTYADAEWASERYLGFTEHATPGCFVCGPAREWGDGLAIYPGPDPGPAPGRRAVGARSHPLRQARAGPPRVRLGRARLPDRLRAARGVRAPQARAEPAHREPDPAAAGGRPVDRHGLAVRGGGPHPAGRLRDLLRERRAARARLGGAGPRRLS